MKLTWALLATFLIAMPSVGTAQDLNGDWQATLHAGVADLHLVLHIAKNDAGGLKATLDSVDQAAYGIPVSSITFKNSTLTLGVDAVHGSYEGKLS
ncbi:MAG: hypothetical protein WCC95_06230, partial [Candidatus Sulfotelmatobacter sp.]